MWSSTSMEKVIDDSLHACLQNRERTHCREYTRVEVLHREPRLECRRVMTLVSFPWEQRSEDKSRSSVRGGGRWRIARIPLAQNAQFSSMRPA